MCREFIEYSDFGDIDDILDGMYVLANSRINNPGKKIVISLLNGTVAIVCPGQSIEEVRENFDAQHRKGASPSYLAFVKGKRLLSDTLKKCSGVMSLSSENIWRIIPDTKVKDSVNKWARVMEYNYAVHNDFRPLDSYKLVFFRKEEKLSSKEYENAVSILKKAWYYSNHVVFPPYPG